MSRLRGLAFLSSFALAGACLWALPALASPGAMSHGEHQALVVQSASGDNSSATAGVRSQRRNGVRVDAPYTHVEAGRRVRVDAPYSHVDVDPNRGHVRVEAPFVDLNIQW